jgi:hypothetical protein
MLSRGGWALTGLAGLSVGLLGPGASRALGDLQGQSFPTALVGLGCLVQLTVASWVLLTVALSLAHAPAPLLRAVTPRLLRRALFVSTAGALALAPVHADQIAPSHPRQHDLVGLRLPDRPVASVARVATSPATVVVRPGDTLWAIAARSLPAGATDAEIARACATWHAANRDVIGDDPNLIFPMQRLVPPLGKDPT